MSDPAKRWTMITILIEDIGEQFDWVKYGGFTAQTQMREEAITPKLLATVAKDHVKGIIEATHSGGEDA